MRFSAARFRSPGFRLTWCASLAWAGGLWMERVAVGWITLQTSDDAGAVGIVFALRMLPFLLFGLISGTLADRFPRRLCLMVTTGSSALASVILGYLSLHGPMPVWVLGLFSFVSGTIYVFDTPARGALVVDMLGRENAASAIAVNSVAQRFFGAVGAFAGGMVIPILGASGSFFLIACVYVVAFLLIVPIHAPVVARDHASIERSFTRQVMNTAHMIVRYPTIRMVVCISIVAEFFGYSHQAALPTVARDILLIGSEGLGLLTAMSSIGATCIVIILAGLPRGVPRAPMVTATLILWGLTLIALGNSTSVPLSLMVIFLVGMCASSIDTLQQTLAQLAVPEAERGRAVGVWVFGIGLNVVGLFQVGQLTSHFGAPVALTLNGLFAIGGAFVIMTLAPSFRLSMMRAAR